MYTLRLKPKHLLFFLYFWSFIYMGVDQFLQVSVLRYVSDIIVFPLFLYAALKKNLKNVGKLQNSTIILLFVESFLAFFFISAESPLVYVWGFRNLFKYFCFWMLCASYLDERDLMFMAKTLFVLTIINTPIMMFQCYGLHLFFDNIGGIQGTATGVNGATNIQLCLTLIVTFVLLLYKRISIFFAIFMLGILLFQATMSELKAFYLEFGLIACAVFSFAKNKKQLLPLMVFSFIFASFFIGMLGIMYSKNEGFFTLDSLMAYADGGGYEEAGNSQIDRTTGFAIISYFFLPTLKEFLFGIGLGAAEPSTFIVSNFNTIFEFWKIHFFNYAVMFLEIGAVGLTLYFAFFTNIIYYTFKRRDIFDYIGIPTALTCIFLMFYNQTLRMDCALAIFAFLALPYHVHSVK